MKRYQMLAGVVTCVASLLLMSCATHSKSDKKAEAKPEAAAPKPEAAPPAVDKELVAATLVPKGTPSAEAMGWHVGCQAYSFNKFSFYEAIDKVKALGLHYIEAYPGQKLSLEKPDAKFDHNMDPALYPEVLARLKAANVKLVNYGVVGLPDEAEARKVFEFAKKMGIETVVAEPPQETFALLDKLTEEYGINVALHNHPKPSRYWNPDAVLAACKGHSKRIGSCADTGHWMRSGVDPLAAVKKLEGRIISFHFKDLGEFRVKEAHDVPWSTGLGKTRAILTELQRQGFKGVFSAEYEHNWENSVPDLALSVANFEAIASSLTELKDKPAPAPEAAKTGKAKAPKKAEKQPAKASAEKK
ncbi:MAG: sugar phosphate isomerase/epimerase [Candidatus Hydrogenedentes bacterium]|nr:sugar phosphate isomerase/epimerase [Candidatus Hydrogenedentota bacterium]